jgi:hypothetical protein
MLTITGAQRRQEIGQQQIVDTRGVENLASGAIGDVPTQITPIGAE